MRARSRLGPLAGAVALAWCLSASLKADERILQFDSTVAVQPNGDLLVNEHIVVRAEGDMIKHGIFRDLPTLYAREGWPKLVPGLFNHHTPMRWLRVQRDGKDEPHHTAGRENGERLYLGAANAYLEPGIHAYDLGYRYERILKFLPDHDELFWNGTGSDWAFPIDQASVTVSLPGDPGPLRLQAYTGVEGSREHAFEARDLGGGRAQFKSTRVLRPGEGLSVVVGWPKGFVRPPTASQRLAWWLNDWREALLGLVALLLVLGLSFLAWLKHGVDPEPRPIVPRFHPPHEFPPAALRYLDERGSDSTGLVASLVEMAVKGRLKISEIGKGGGWTLERLEGKAEGEIEEAIDHLFTSMPKVDTTAVSDQPNFRAALRMHDVAVRAGYPPEVANNLNHLAVPAVIAIIADLILGLWATVSPPAVFLGFLLLAMAAGCGYALTGAWDALRIGRIGMAKGKLAAFLAGAAFSAVFAVAVGSALTFAMAAPWQALCCLVCGLSLGAFANLIAQPSEAQQRLQDDIQGFTLYLSTAESHRLEVMNPPEETPQLFEKYLPYALALEVGEQWGKRMEAVLKRAELDGSYHPGWISTYGMTRGMAYVGLSNLGGDLGSSLSGSIASASAPPSSSGGSGFGGGGGMGGGGGGGGGGGW